MQIKIQPKTYSVKVACTCGNKFSIMSTQNIANMHVEHCFKCHSAYTGKRKIATAGSIEKFQKKFAAYTGAISDSSKTEK